MGAAYGFGDLAGGMPYGDEVEDVPYGFAVAGGGEAYGFEESGVAVYGFEVAYGLVVFGFPPEAYGLDEVDLPRGAGWSDTGGRMSWMSGTENSSDGRKGEASGVLLAADSDRDVSNEVCSIAGEWSEAFLLGSLVMSGDPGTDGHVPPGLATPSDCLSAGAATEESSSEISSETHWPDSS